MNREIVDVVEGVFGQFVIARFEPGHEHRRSDCPDFQSWFIHDGAWRIDRPSGTTEKHGAQAFLRLQPFEKCHRIVTKPSSGTGLRIFRSNTTDKIVPNSLALRRMSRLNMEGRFDGLVLDCLIQDLPVARKHNPPKWLRQVHDLLHDDPTTNWSIQQFAAVASISPSRLIHEYKAHYGERIFEARNRLRIERHLRTAESAVELGFYDHSHFHREAKKRLAPLEVSSFVQAENSLNERQS